MDRPRQYPIGAEVTIEELTINPHPVMARLRSTEPVSWVPAVGGWVVSRRDIAIEVMRDDQTFTVDDPRFTTGQVVGPSMLSTDGAEHDRHRTPWVAPFGFAAVRDTLEDYVIATARSLVAKLASQGCGDLRADLAAPLAVRSVLKALGLDAVEPETVLRWYGGIVESVTALTAGKAPTTLGAESFEQLSDAVLATMNSDAKSLLAAVVASGELSETEVVSNAAVVMFGGIETSEATTSNALLLLLSHPGQLEAVVDDRRLVSAVVEESLRLEPAAASVDRYATSDVSIGGADIATGDFVSVSIAGANRDPEWFDHPDAFDVSRPNATKHLTFVRGPHACLGIHLAKLEARSAIEAVLDGLVDVQLDLPISEAEGLVFRKPPSVACRWTRDSRV